LYRCQITGAGSQDLFDEYGRKDISLFADLDDDPVHDRQGEGETYNKPASFPVSSLKLKMMVKD
jgi:hypothetical protein